MTRLDNSLSPLGVVEFETPKADALALQCVLFLEKCLGESGRGQVDTLLFHNLDDLD